MDTGESLGERLYPNYLHMLSIFCVKPDCANGKIDSNHFRTNERLTRDVDNMQK